ncbi:MAG: hypothetical protein ACI4EY_04925 [Lachnospiraceae bacterium]
MKKEYVKPVIESEEFVANEYVAACYRITCIGHKGIQSHTAHGSITLQLEKDPNPDFFDLDEDGFVYYVSPPYGNSYMGKIGGENGPHPIEWKNITSPAHPNASA